MNLKALFFCSETLELNYASVENLFGYMLQKKGITHTWVAPSSKVVDVERFEADYASGWIFPKKRPSSVKELILFYRETFKDLQKITAYLQNSKYDLVIVRDDPLLAHFAYKLSRIWNIPFLYQLSHFKEEETLLSRGKKVTLSWIFKTLKGKVALHLRNHYLKKADKILPISERMAETLAREYRISKEAMVVLHEGVEELPVIESKAVENLRKELAIINCKVLVYVGTLDASRQLNFILDVFKSVQHSYPHNLKFLIVGDGLQGNEINNLKAYGAKLGISDNLVFTGRVERKKVPLFIAAADIGLSPIVPNQIYLNSSPIKILEYMQLGIPVVASNIPAQESLISVSGGGYCVEHKLEEFSAAVVELLSSQKTAWRMGEAGKKYVQEHRTFKRLSETLFKCYLSLYNN